MEDNVNKAVIPFGPRGVVLNDFESARLFARCYLESGLAPGSFRNENQLIIAWAKAAELGLTPLQAIDGMAVINNKVGIMGDLALAMCEASGQLAECKVEYVGQGDTYACHLTLQRKGREPQVYKFGVAQARKAGLWGKPGPWTQYPERMLRYRALGFGLRDVFADILKGVKTVEELADYPDGQILQEEKIAYAQEHDEELKEKGVKFVESTGTQPTPAQAAEPAFPEEREDHKPPFQQQLEEDFLDLSSDVPPPKAAAGSPSSPAAAPPDWQNYIIQSFGKTGIGAKLSGKRLGDISPQLLGIVEERWIPAIRQQWTQANAAQQTDAEMFELAIKHSKMAKPW